MRKQSVLSEEAAAVLIAFRTLACMSHEDDSKDWRIYQPSSGREYQNHTYLREGALSNVGLE